MDCSVSYACFVTENEVDDAWKRAVYIPQYVAEDVSTAAAAASAVDDDKKTTVKRRETTHLSFTGCARYAYIIS